MFAGRRFVDVGVRGDERRNRLAMTLTRREMDRREAAPECDLFGVVVLAIESRDLITRIDASAAAAAAATLSGSSLARCSRRLP